MIYIFVQVYIHGIYVHNIPDTYMLTVYTIYIVHMYIHILIVTV